MGLSPEQIGDITNRSLAIRKLMGTEAGRLFSQQFETGREARIAGGEERRLDISERQVDASEERNKLAEARDQVDSEYKAALTVGATQTAETAKRKRDILDRQIVMQDALMGLGGQTAEDVRREIAGLPKPTSQVPTERLAHTRRQAVIKSEQIIGQSKGKKDMVAGDVKNYNESMAAEGSPFMYVWSTRFDNEWEKVRIPSGWTYEDVLFTANKHNISSYEVLKRMGAAK